MKQLEFERLFFPIQVRCQALDCLMNRGAIKRPERAVWQEKNTGILLCDRDKVRVEGSEESFVGLKEGTAIKPYRRLTSVDQGIREAHARETCPTNRRERCPLFGSEYCPVECPFNAVKARQAEAT